MSKYKDKVALEKIVRARTNLLVSNGFFGFLAMQLRIVEVPEEGHYLSGHVKTMAVDGVSLFYYPKFVHTLDEREIEGVVAHEVMHCCFKHFTRRQNRNPQIWNIAGDFVINNDLTGSGFTLPKSALLDPKYNGMTTEEVYDKLPVTYIKVSGLGDGDDPGGCGGVLDAPGGAAGEEATKQTWETAVRQAVAVAKANNAGNLPGSLQRLIDDLQKPKVSWKDLTKNFIDGTLSKEISWSRISRRSTALGTLMPGYIPDRLNHLVFAVDSSGSIAGNPALLKEFVSEVAGALDQGTADQLTVLYADTRVHDVDSYVPGDYVEAKDLHQGGGGTAFSDTFRHIKENFPDASAVIYLTDLQVYDFGEDPGCPVLWAVYASSANYPALSAQAPFGQCIHVSDAYG